MSSSTTADITCLPVQRSSGPGQDDPWGDFCSAADVEVASAPANELEAEDGWGAFRAPLQVARPSSEAHQGVGGAPLPEDLFSTVTAPASEALEPLIFPRVIQGALPEDAPAHKAVCQAELTIDDKSQADTSVCAKSANDNHADDTTNDVWGLFRQPVPTEAAPMASQQDEPGAKVSPGPACATTVSIAGKVAAFPAPCRTMTEDGSHFPCLVDGDFSWGEFAAPAVTVAPPAQHEPSGNDSPKFSSLAAGPLPADLFSKPSFASAPVSGPAQSAADLNAAQADSIFEPRSEAELAAHALNSSLVGGAPPIRPNGCNKANELWGSGVDCERPVDVRRLQEAAVQPSTERPRSPIVTGIAANGRGSDDGSEEWQDFAAAPVGEQVAPGGDGTSSVAEASSRPTLQEPDDCTPDTARSSDTSYTAALLRGPSALPAELFCAPTSSEPFQGNLAAAAADFARRSFREAGTDASATLDASVDTAGASATMCLNEMGERPSASLRACPVDVDEPSGPACTALCDEDNMWELHASTVPSTHAPGTSGCPDPAEGAIGGLPLGAVAMSDITAGDAAGTSMLAAASPTDQSWGDFAGDHAELAKPAIESVCGLERGVDASGDDWGDFLGDGGLQVQVRPGSAAVEQPDTSPAAEQSRTSSAMEPFGTSQEAEQSARSPVVELSITSPSAQAAQDALLLAFYQTGPDHQTSDHVDMDPSVDLNDAACATAGEVTLGAPVVPPPIVTAQICQMSPEALAPAVHTSMDPDKDADAVQAQSSEAARETSDADVPSSGMRSSGIVDTSDVERERCCLSSLFTIDSDTHLTMDNTAVGDAAAGGTSGLAAPDQELAMRSLSCQPSNSSDKPPYHAHADPPDRAAECRHGHASGLHSETRTSGSLPSQRSGNGDASAAARVPCSLPGEEPLHGPPHPLRVRMGSAASSQGNDGDNLQLRPRGPSGRDCSWADLAGVGGAAEEALPLQGRTTTEVAAHAHALPPVIAGEWSEFSVADDASVAPQAPLASGSETSDLPGGAAGSSGEAASPVHCLPVMDRQDTDGGLGATAPSSPLSCAPGPLELRPPSDDEEAPGQTMARAVSDAAAAALAASPTKAGLTEPRQQDGTDPDAADAPRMFARLLTLSMRRMASATEAEESFGATPVRRSVQQASVRQHLAEKCISMFGIAASAAQVGFNEGMTAQEIVAQTPGSFWAAVSMLERLARHMLRHCGEQAPPHALLSADAELEGAELLGDADASAATAARAAGMRDEGLVLYMSSILTIRKAAAESRRLTQILEAFKLPFEEVDLAAVPHRRSRMIKAAGDMRELPQLHCCGCFIGTASACFELHDFGELIPMLQISLQQGGLAGAGEDGAGGCGVVRGPLPLPPDVLQRLHDGVESKPLAACLEHVPVNGEDGDVQDDVDSGDVCALTGLPCAGWRTDMLALSWRTHGSSNEPDAMIDHGSKEAGASLPVIVAAANLWLTLVDEKQPSR